MTDMRDARRPEPDKLLCDIADYVLAHDELLQQEQTLLTANLVLMDSLACAFGALQLPACNKLLGPIVPGGELINGARVPGTGFELDPVQAAFNTGMLIRWLDYNDTWLAAEWGHPSDNLGGILSVADFLARQQYALRVADIFNAMIRAHEIQGVLALNNSFNEVGLDHVLLVRIATTAVTCGMLGGNRQQIIDALSNAWLDGGALRTYRHAPNTGSRKSWAAGDATSRGVRLALMTMQGEMGYPSALSATRWGFQDVLFNGKEIALPQPLGSYVMDNILFKVAFPAEFHAQTAAEAAIQLHPLVKNRIDDIAAVTIETQNAGATIIDKTGPLDNPADRDHCIQYIVAVGLLFGEITTEHYEDTIAADPRIDQLRNKIQVTENSQFTEDYFNSDKRAIANAVQVKFNDGSQTDRIEILYPLGHRQRRQQALPLLFDKFEQTAGLILHLKQTTRLIDLFQNPQTLIELGVDDFMAMLVPGR